MYEFSIVYWGVSVNYWIVDSCENIFLLWLSFFYIIDLFVKVKRNLKFILDGD